MAEGPSPDQGAALFARGGNAQPADTTKPATSMQELMDQLFEQLTNWASKATGVRLNSMLNVGIFGGTKLEDGAIKSGNNIVMASVAQGSQGGVLAGVASTVFNWDMQGVSAPPIDAASGGDSGAGTGSSSSSSDFESYAQNSGMGEMFIAAGGGNRFSYEDFSPASLGSISPPSIGSAGLGEGAGMSV